MQKKLSDYMKTIINRKDLLRCVRVGADVEVRAAAILYFANQISHRFIQ